MLQWKVGPPILQLIVVLSAKAAPCIRRARALAVVRTRSNNLVVFLHEFGVILMLSFDCIISGEVLFCISVRLYTTMATDDD